MATKSKFSDVLSKIAFVIAVLLTLFQSYTALFGVLTAVYQRAIHLGLASSYIFLFNMANPKVREEVKDIMRFWLDMGVDGFREDVITYIAKADGLPSAKVKPCGDGNAVLHQSAEGSRLSCRIQARRS